MAHTFISWTLLLLTVCLASGLETEQEGRNWGTYVIDLGGGQTAAGSQTITSSTALNTTFLGYALLGILLCGCLVALAFFLISSLQRDEGSYNSDGYYRSFGGETFDFSHLNILDWISMAEEMYRSYDADNSDCYKRLLCETFKNKKLSGVARTVDTATRWLGFLEIIRYSDLFSEFFDEAIDAIDRGKSVDKCSEVYDSCDFSVSRIIHKYFDHNNIGDEQNVEYL